MEKIMTEAEKVIASAPKEIREAHSKRIEEIRNKDIYKTRVATANAREVISNFIIDVLADPTVKENPEMVAAIAELAKVIS